MPRLSAATLLALLAERGWLREHLADRSDVSRRTITTVFAEENVSAATLASIAAALKVEPRTLLLDPPPGAAGFARDLSGTWSGTARDLEVPGLIQYTIPPVNYTFEMEVRQAGWSFTATGGLIGQ